MGKITCEKCGKEFNQKSHYTTHMNKKNPCVVESKIKEMIDIAVKEKLVEIKKSSQIEFEIIEEEDIIYDNKLVSTPKKIHIPKPILKWVGGKTQILDKLMVEFPSEINNYHEIFLGGGSVLLTVLSYIKEGVIKLTGTIYAHDLNEPLIYVYKNIQSSYNELYVEMQKLIKEYITCGNVLIINRKPTNFEEATQTKENYYYWIRTKYNNLSLLDKNSCIGSAMFIFLNKTCFRGLFRVGPSGFNVPYGHYKNPEIINKDHLCEIHHLIQGVVFECSDFTKSLSNVVNDDFVYLDPPYAPETASSFVGYTLNGFNIEHHNNLFKLLHALTERKQKILLSNADVNLVRENFTNDKYIITSILCKRSIHSKNPSIKTLEVIIKNY
jgi:DNA adenine methylase